MKNKNKKDIKNKSNIEIKEPKFIEWKIWSEYNYTYFKYYKDEKLLHINNHFDLTEWWKVDVEWWWGWWPIQSKHSTIFEQDSIMYEVKNWTIPKSLFLNPKFLLVLILRKMKKEQ